MKTLAVTFFGSLTIAFTVASPAVAASTCDQKLGGLAVDTALAVNARQLHELRISANQEIEKLGINIPSVLLPRFQQAFADFSAYVARSAKEGYSEEAADAQDRRIGELVREVLVHPSNSSIFKATTDRPFHSTSLFRYIRNPNIAVAFENRVILLIAEFAYTNLVMSDGRNFFKASIAYDHYVRVLDERHSLQATRERELGKMTMQQIHERRRFVNSEMRNLRQRFLQNANLPSPIISLLRQLADMASSDAEFLAPIDLVESIEDQVNEGAEKKWHLGTLALMAKAFQGSDMTREDLESYFRKFVIDDHQSKMMPKEAYSYYLAVESELRAINTVIGTATRN